MTYTAMLDVMEGRKRGQQIQWLCPDFGRWVNLPDDDYDFSRFEYRVKPKPMRMRDKAGVLWQQVIE